MLFVGVEELFSKQLNTQLIDDIRIASNDEFPIGLALDWLKVVLLKSNLSVFQSKKKLRTKDPKSCFQQLLKVQSPMALLQYLIISTDQWNGLFKTKKTI